MSLPFGMKLVVKEHPRSFGLRPVEYYRSLLQIPNLYFVPMQANSLEVSRHADLVCVISSTIEFEACCIGKLLLLLGHAKFEALPSSMFELCENLLNCQRPLERLLANYQYDKSQIIGIFGRCNRRFCAHRLVFCTAWQARAPFGRKVRLRKKKLKKITGDWQITLRPVSLMNWSIKQSNELLFYGRPPNLSAIRSSETNEQENET